MRCGRRADPFSPAALFQGEDEWLDGRGPQPTCSYCGSIAPERFLEAAGAGAEIEPTDKDYKVYVNVDDPRVGEEAVFGSSSGAERPNEGWVAIGERERELMRRDGGGSGPHDVWVLIRPRPARAHVKFYFQHLNAEQRRTFIALMNAKTLNLAYPGHFYVLPFFAMKQRSA